MRQGGQGFASNVDDGPLVGFSTFLFVIVLPRYCVRATDGRRRHLINMRWDCCGRRSRRRLRKCPLSSIQHGVTHEGKALHLLARSPAHSDYPTHSLCKYRARGLRRERSRRTDNIHRRQRRRRRPPRRDGMEMGGGPLLDRRRKETAPFPLSFSVSLTTRRRSRS